MNTELNDSTKDLIIRYLAGEASPEQQQQLLAWVNAIAENKKQFEQFEKLFRLSDTLYAAGSDLDIDVDKEWLQFVNETRKPKEPPVVQLNPNPYVKKVWYRVAAAILIMLVAGYGINFLLNKTETLNFASGSNSMALDLPDGSKVILNQHSSVSYQSDFGKESRSLKLQGEAFFDVKADKEHPFVIDVRDGKVEVVGTSFNVRAYDSLQETEVIVQTGRVKFSASEVKNELMLSPGQKGVFSKEKNVLSIAENKDVNFLSWETRKLSFTDASFTEVIRTLERVYGVTITLPANIPASCALTASFDHQSLDSVFKVLQSTWSLEYRIDGNHIEIISVGC